jgi:hypothetical protein
VDNETKRLFNGIDLGKTFSRAALQSKLPNLPSENKSTPGNRGKEKLATAKAGVTK